HCDDIETLGDHPGMRQCAVDHVQSEMALRLGHGMWTHIHPGNLPAAFAHSVGVPTGPAAVIKEPPASFKWNIGHRVAITAEQARTPTPPTPLLVRLALRTGGRLIGLIIFRIKAADARLVRPRVEVSHAAAAATN